MLFTRRKNKYEPHEQGRNLIDYAGAMVAEAADAAAEAIEHFRVQKARSANTITALSSLITEEHIKHETSHRAQIEADELIGKLDVLHSATGEV